mgnify:CR=1 FL=1|tara:strand:+ start:4103 stop:4525 length:423 start_codon:yes stop_codon:yes gene_type:complete
MAGIIKECRQCGINFRTKTIKAGAWQAYCNPCFGARQESNAEKSIKKRQSHMFEALDDRIKRIEEKSQHMDMLVSAEISNALTNLSNNDLFNSVNDAMQKALEEKKKQIDADNKKFKDKIQKQLVMLNNKLVKIMQEMEK